MFTEKTLLKPRSRNLPVIPHREEAREEEEEGPPVVHLEDEPVAGSGWRVVRFAPGKVHDAPENGADVHGAAADRGHSACGREGRR